MYSSNIFFCSIKILKFLNIVSSYLEVNIFFGIWKYFVSLVTCINLSSLWPLLDLGSINDRFYKFEFLCETEYRIEFKFPHK